MLGSVLGDVPKSSGENETFVFLREQKQKLSYVADRPGAKLIRPGLQGIDLLGLARQNKWTYEQWVAQLEEEAIATVEAKPQRLTVLLGDSLSLWFPVTLLPTNRNWLNQGISGETTRGLFRRLDILERTRPETIFLMIGINDLLRGIDDFTLLNNYENIVKDLRLVHPHSQIVIQSILPHGGETATWEGKKRLLKIPQSRIRELNQQLRAIAQKQGAFYLDLHPLFTDQDGQLRSELSTDGLHLNEQGYMVWRTAIELYSQVKLNQPD
ncbi:MAG: GDSL-type esterase/lipase family protein [Microcoleaceae cyanobacterium]